LSHSDVLCDENNNVMGQNMTLKRPQLAKTLRAIADGGADAFYTGDIARSLVKDIQDAGIYRFWRGKLSYFCWHVLEPAKINARADVIDKI